MLHHVGGHGYAVFGGTTCSNGRVATCLKNQNRLHANVNHVCYRLQDNHQSCCWQTDVEDYTVITQPTQRRGEMNGTSFWSSLGQVKLVLRFFRRAGGGKSTPAGAWLTTTRQTLISYFPSAPSLV
eukprot:1162067-Pelagomonas_calceolata.AAC.9